MEGSKHPLLSRGVIGSLVAILLSIANALNVEGLAGIDPAPVVDAIFSVATGVAALVALWGRIAATKKIGG